MAGVTESEGTSWAVADRFGQKLSNTPYHITKAEVKTEIKSRFHSFGDEFVDKIYDFYISKIDENNQTLIRKAYIAILSDTIIKCPTYYFTEKLAQFSASNKVYFYELTYNSKISGCHSEQWKGVCHSDDIVFVSGYIRENNSQYSETDYEFALMVDKIWTNFAKNGYNFRGIKIKLSIN
jgi:carboxylesterase type B